MVKMWKTDCNVKQELLLTPQNGRRSFASGAGTDSSVVAEEFIGQVQEVVKEVRKSSSNGRKWSCAICNEKQSVHKVFSSADTDKEVRKFVQQFNLTAGQAAQTEIISRLESGSPIEDSSYDYRYQEDEEGHMNGTMGADNYVGQKKSFKWDMYLPDEEQVCSGDEFQQSSDDMRFTTTLPEPTSRRRMRPRSSSPSPKRASRGFTTSRDDTDAE